MFVFGGIVNGKRVNEVSTSITWHWKLVLLHTVG